MILKKGTQVRIISVKDKGKTGEILEINRKLNKGIPIEIILTENTLPGFSEHHSGNAIDFLSDNSYSLSVEFEKTKTFKWLTENANKYGFYLSYPKNNKDGIMYEPWHWMYKNE